MLLAENGAGCGSQYDNNHPKGTPHAVNFVVDQLNEHFLKLKKLVYEQR